MGLWSKIKSWFTGGNKTTTKSNNNLKQSRIPQNRATTSVSVRNGYRGSQISARQKEEEKKQPKREVYKVETKHEYKKATPPAPRTSEQKQFDNQLNASLKRTSEKKKVEKPKAKVVSSQYAYKPGQGTGNEKEKKKYEEEYRKKVGADKKSKAQLKLEQKMQLPDRIKTDAEMTAKYHPHQYAASRGLLGGVTLGGSKAMMKYGGSDDIKKIDEDFTKNESKADKRLEFASEMAGNMATYGASSGLSKAAGSKMFKVADRIGKADNMSKGLATKGAEAVEKHFVEKYGAKAGKKMFDALKTDVAINSTTGLAHNALLAANEDGDLGDKAKAFAGNVALTAAMGTGLTVLPTRLTERASIKAFRNLKAGELKGSAGKNAPKLKSNKYAFVKNEIEPRKSYKAKAVLSEDDIAARELAQKKASVDTKKTIYGDDKKIASETRKAQSEINRLASQREQGLLDEETFIKERDRVTSALERVRKDGVTFEDAMEGRLNLVDSDIKHKRAVNRGVKQKGYSTLESEAEIERARRGRTEIAENGELAKQRNAKLELLEEQKARGEITPYEYNQKKHAIYLEHEVKSYSEADRLTQTFDESVGASAENREVRETVKDVRQQADELYDKAVESQRKVSELQIKAARTKRKAPRNELRRQWRAEQHKANEYTAEANRLLEEADNYVGNLKQANEERIFGEPKKPAMLKDKIATKVEPPKPKTETTEFTGKGSKLLNDANKQLSKSDKYAATDDAIPFGDNRTDLDRQTDDVVDALNKSVKYENKPVNKNNPKTTKQLIKERAWKDLPDDVDEARMVAAEMSESKNIKAENKYVGEYKKTENDCISEYLEASKRGDKEGMARAKAKAQAFRELDEGTEQAAKKIYSKETMDFSQLNNHTEGVASDGIAIRDAESFKEYRKRKNERLAPNKRVSDTAESAYLSTNSDVERELYKQLNKDDSVWTYLVAHNKAKLDKAIADVFSRSTPADEINMIARYVRTGENPNHKQYLDTIYKANVLREYVSMMLPETSGSQRQQAVEALEVLNQYLATRVGESGQILQAQKFYRYMSPSTRALTTKQGLAQLFKARGIIETVEEFDKILADQKQLRQFIDDIANGKNTEEIANAERQAKQYARSIVGRTWGELWNEWRYTGMLTSVPTHVRNMGGNLFNAVKGVTDDSIAGLLQKSGAFYKGEEESLARTKSVNPLGSVHKLYRNKESAGFKAMRDTYKKNLPDMLAGAKYEDIKMKSDVVYKKGGKLVTKNKAVKALDSVSNFNTRMLDHEDELFMRANYEKQFAQVLDVNKFGLGKEGGQVLSNEKILELAERTAVDEALHMTFRDYSRTAQMLNQFVKKGLDPNASMIEKIASRGLNITVPFVKTPINILKQSAIDNTTIGLIKGIRDISKASSPEAVDKALSEIAKGTTGTGIMALGIMLGMRDETEKFSITTNLSDSDRDKNFKNHGFKDYSIRIGDSSVPLAWLTPLSASFFIGGTMGKELRSFNDRQGEKGVFYDSIASAGHVASAILEPLLETTMLSGLNTTLESATSDDEQNSLINLANGIKNNAISQSMPTLFKQVAKTIAPYDYLYLNRAESKGGQDLEYLMKSNFKSLAAPITGREEGGLAHMAAATDVRGNIRGEKTSGADYLKSAALNLLSPTKPSKIQWDDTDTETLKLYDELVKDPSSTKQDSAKNIFERNNYDTKAVAGKTELDLTDDDVSRVNQSKQRAGSDAITSALETKAMNKTDIRMSDERKQEIIDSVKGKSLHDAIGVIQKLPEYQGLSAEEKKTVNLAMMGDGSSHLDKGASSYAKKELYENRDMPKGQYEFDNEMTEKQQEGLSTVVDKLGYEKTMELVHASQKVSYSDADSDNNGQRTVSYSRERLINALDAAGITDEDTRAAFYNTMKQSNAKEYYPGMSATYSSGYGRRGYGGYRHYGSGGSKQKASTSSASKIYSKKNTYTKAPTTNATKIVPKKTGSTVTDAYIQKILNQTKEK